MNEDDTVEMLFEEFEEAYNDEKGEYTEREVLQLLLHCLNESYYTDKPISSAVHEALETHIELLLEGDESWLLRPADKRESSPKVVIAKATAVVYVEEHPDEKKAVAELYGISTRTLNRWMKRYPGGGGEWTYSDIEACAKDYKCWGR